MRGRPDLRVYERATARKSKTASVSMAQSFDRDISAYLRANVLGAPVHSRISCFVAKFDPDSDSDYLSYAVPDDEAEPDAVAIGKLIGSFAVHRRRPRLEYIPNAASKVEAALRSAGFVVEGRYPVMACKRAEQVRADGYELRLVRSPEEVLEAAKALAQAFEEETLDTRSLQAEIDSGGLLAMAIADGQVAGVAMATAARNAVVEIVGIGVVPAFRRRGIGTAVTGFVTAEAFARGVRLAWLTPRNGDAQRIYARAGFVPASEQLHMSKPM